MNIFAKETMVKTSLIMGDKLNIKLADGSIVLIYYEHQKDSPFKINDSGKLTGYESLDDIITALGNDWKIYNDETFLK